MSVDYQQMNHVFDKLCISDSNWAFDLNNLKREGVEAVICITRESPGDGVEDAAYPAEYLHYLKDYLHFPIEDAYPLPEYIISKSLDFIGENLSSGRNVLVHCTGGASRSVALALCHLFRMGMGFDEAQQFLKAKRPQAIFRDELMSSIKEYFNISNIS